MKLYRIKFRLEGKDHEAYALVENEKDIKAFTQSNDFTAWDCELLAASTGKAPYSLMDLRGKSRE